MRKLQKNLCLLLINLSLIILVYSITTVSGKEKIDSPNIDERFDEEPITRHTHAAPIFNNADDIYWENKISPKFSGIGGQVNASIEYNGLLIVGGKFSAAGSSFVNNIAAWDGTSWKSIENVTNSIQYKSVSALVVHDNKLVVAGLIGKVEGKPIYLVSTWDGNNWTALQSTTNDIQYNNISALTVYKEKLFATASFEKINRTNEYFVLFWNDSSWTSIGEIDIGIQVPYRNNYQRKNLLVVFQDLLIVGGDFDKIFGYNSSSLSSNIASWNGSSWQSLEVGLKGTYSNVSTLTVFKNILLVTGNFTTAGNISVDEDAAAIWDGTKWNLFERGFMLPFENRGKLKVHTTWKGQVILSQRLTGYDWTSLEFLLWDGHSLKSDGFAKDLDGLFGSNYHGIFTTYGDQLIILGDSKYQPSFWDGTNWIPLEKDGTKGRVNSTVVFDEMLIAGGTLKEIGGVKVNNIAAWNGLIWLPIGEEISMGEEVTALSVFNNKLIVATISHGIGMGQSLEFPRLYSWDGNTWLDIGNGFLYSKVETMIVYENKLIVAGGGGLVVGPSAIATWDGYSWESLEFGIETWEKLYALEEYNNQLIVAGKFKNVDNNSGDNIVSWNGNSWSALDLGLGTLRSRPGEIVYDLTVYDNQLIAAGIINSASGKSVNNITAWDGLSWSSLDSGIAHADSYLDGVRVLTVFEDQLIVAGNFDSASGELIHNIASWNGYTWSSLGSGISSVEGRYPSVSTLSVYKNNLIIGGSFLTAGGKVSASLAEWTKKNRRSRTRIGNPKLSLPHGFQLSQNYPNPFNPTTTISFSLPEASDVKLEVFNIQGQRVSTLVNTQLDAGNHSINWNSRDAASGVYLYRLETSSFTETKKMLLLK